MSNDHEGPDTRGPAVIVDGSVIGGFNFIGPFRDMETAHEWHVKQSLPGMLGIPVTIVLLEDPETAAVMSRGKHEQAIRRQQFDSRKL